MRLPGAAGICTSVCPSNDALLGYFERRLRPRRVQQISAHLDDCDACRTILVILVRDRRLSSAAGSETR